MLTQTKLHLTFICGVWAGAAVIEGHKLDCQEKKKHLDFAIKYFYISVIVESLDCSLPL